MWKFQLTDLYERRLNRLVKNHPDAVHAAAENLKQYLASLNQGASPARIRTSFIHPEPGGVIAIDQTGGGRKLAKLHLIRLYIFPDPATLEIILITIGDKQTQRADLKDCAAFVKQFREDQAP